MIIPPLKPAEYKALVFLKWFARIACGYDIMVAGYIIFFESEQRGAVSVVTGALCLAVIMGLVAAGADWYRREYDQQHPPDDDEGAVPS